MREGLKMMGVIDGSIEMKSKVERIERFVKGIAQLSHKTGIKIEQAG